MSSVDDHTEEPFKLNLNSIQGRWLCEELGASLTVSGNAVQYTSGECYPIEASPEGKLEIFGYRGLEKKSDASSVVWKNKETGQYLTWIYEGDTNDPEPEVDTSLIINQGEGRTTRKRKVDYVSLDKVLDQESGKQGAWQSEYEQVRSAPKSEPSTQDIESAFSRLKSQFNKWLSTTNTDRCRLILSKRGYVSTEIDFLNTSSDKEAASRFVLYLKTIGVKAAISQTGSSVNVRVPDTIWPKLMESVPTFSSGVAVESAEPDVTRKVERIRDEIIRFCNDSSNRDLKAQVEASLAELESLPINLEILKVTKVGVEMNKLSKFLDRAKETLNHLKTIYLESKKV
jgi:hypothetical protein